MPFMDKVKSGAAQAAQKAQEAAKAGQAKIDQVQAKRELDSMFRDLGAAVYAQRKGSGDSAEIDRLVDAISAHEQQDSARQKRHRPPIRTRQRAISSSTEWKSPSSFALRTPETAWRSLILTARAHEQARHGPSSIDPRCSPFWRLRKARRGPSARHDPSDGSEPLQRLGCRALSAVRDWAMSFLRSAACSRGSFVGNAPSPGCADRSRRSSTTRKKSDRCLRSRRRKKRSAPGRVGVHFPPNSSLGTTNGSLRKNRRCRLDTSSLWLHVHHHS